MNCSTRSLFTRARALAAFAAATASRFSAARSASISFQPGPKASLAAWTRLKPPLVAASTALLPVDDPRQAPIDGLVAFRPARFWFRFGNGKICRARVAPAEIGRVSDSKCGVAYTLLSGLDHERARPGLDPALASEPNPVVLSLPESTQAVRQRC